MYSLKTTDAFTAALRMKERIAEEFNKRGEEYSGTIHFRFVAFNNTGSPELCEEGFLVVDAASQRACMLTTSNGISYKFCTGSKHHFTPVTYEPEFVALMTFIREEDRLAEMVFNWLVLSRKQ